MTTRVCIGIHVYAEPERLRATLDALGANTARAFELLLLPDGPDMPTRAALARLPQLPRLGTDEPHGAPACFNRLAAASDADVLVLLESGALVGPGWLDHLLAALAAEPRNGLAGPSTNHGWNEQAAFPRATPATLAAAALAAAERYGATAQSLEPLYSLGDFCYAVRREVVAAIGAADEGYGCGPCWEMDYNIRAARAGWRGVWAAGAFVYRAPFTARRRADEARLIAASKARYQDKFCALRLRGERPDYEPHCRGEACEHFAPAGHIPLHLPLAPQGDIQPRPPAEQRKPPAAAPFPAPAPPRQPLVSCIMPTRNRAAFALRAVEYFQRQDYEPRELIIIDDGDDGLARRLPADARIRYARMPAGTSIGAKRNRACELAGGAIIAHWDDDDWYAPGRLSAQVVPLHGTPEAISALTAGVFFDLPAWAFWRCTPALHRRMFVGDVHGGTLVYHRTIWGRLARYPDRSLAEDALFLQQALARGVPLHRL
ncbi:MAG: glycosyltransferase, partial [Chloroflexales bacterium]|nr:glycosyltransferase [Chloroflexales bacterium]